MPHQHTVKQGEHFSRIAAQYGFTDYRILWNHPNNADLAKLRKTPNVLLPGDSLFVPDKQAKRERAQTGRRHRYQWSGQGLALRIAVTDYDSQPVANVDCELEVEKAVYKVKSNGQGIVEHEIPRTAENGVLRIPSAGIEIPLKIGHLDPLDEESGWKGRLINLGYFEGGDDPLRLRYAIEEFQCDQGIKITGEPDAPTKAKLKDVHGA